MFNDGGLAHRCCVCKKIRVIDRDGKKKYIEMNVADDIPISDGYCPECYAKWEADFLKTYCNLCKGSGEIKQLFPPYLKVKCHACGGDGLRHKLDRKME